VTRHMYSIQISFISLSTSGIVCRLSEMYAEIPVRLTRDQTEFKRSPLRGDAQFEHFKTRFLVVHSMLRAHPEAPFDKKEHVMNSIFTSKDLKDVEKSLTNPESNLSSYAKGVISFFSVGYGFGDLREEGRRMPESEFVMKLSEMVAEEPILAAAATRMVDYFIQKVRERVHALASSWAHLVSKVELDAFNQHLRLEATAIENKDQLASRAELLRDLRKDLVHSGPPR
jgi:hypothetical protein